MRQDNIIIRREAPADYAAVEHLIRETFWNVYRPGCMEHYVVHVLHEDPDFVPELGLAMERDGELIGHVLYMRVKIVADDGREISMMSFSPISIRPDLQRQGHGKYLLDYSIERARELGTGILCIEGNIDFYRKSGFVVAGTKGIRYHGEPEQENVPYVLLKELQLDFLDGVTGVYHTPKGCYVDEAAAEEFDRNFQPKEKLKPPDICFEFAGRAPKILGRCEQNKTGTPKRECLSSGQNRNPSLVFLWSNEKSPQFLLRRFPVLVDLIGIEPTTLRMRTVRSPS